jgi:hypothetical protein
MADTPIIVLNDAKSWIGIDLADTSQDFRLQIMIDAVDKVIKDHCEAAFSPQVVVGEILDGTRSDILVTKNSPIISVQQIKTDVTGAIEGNVMDPSEYYASEDSITLRWRVTPKGRGTVKVDYTWGYAEIPAPVKQAALLAVEAMYNRKNRNSIGISSRSKEREAESYPAAWDGVSGLPKEAMSLLTPYRSVEFPVINTPQRNV